MLSFFRDVILVLMLCVPATKVTATTRYVKPLASGAATGLSWVDASSDLQAMINASSMGDEVWVTAGVYCPTQDPLGSLNPVDSRDKTFRLKEGVRVYGGFTGIEITVAARNWTSNLTILSGDLGVANTASDNSYHVVLAWYPLGSTNTGATLDGFTVQSGNANGASWFVLPGSFGNIVRAYGGGIHICNGSPTTLRNLKVVGNVASQYGGGIYGVSAHTLLIHNTVRKNSALNVVDFIFMPVIYRQIVQL